jgi:hypothetical protein
MVAHHIGLYLLPNNLEYSLNPECTLHFEQRNFWHGNLTPALTIGVAVITCRYAAIKAFLAKLIVTIIKRPGFCRDA